MMNEIEKEMIKTMASLMRKLELNPKEQICLDELTNRRIEVNVNKAKKEVFDDKIVQYQFACLESWCASRHESKGDFCQNCTRLYELKQRHLSTFPKEKRHNSSSKKDCLMFCQICNEATKHKVIDDIYYCCKCSPS